MARRSARCGARRAAAQSRDTLTATSGGSSRRRRRASSTNAWLRPRRTSGTQRSQSSTSMRARITANRMRRGIVPPTQEGRNRSEREASAAPSRSRRALAPAERDPGHCSGRASCAPSRAILLRVKVPPHPRRGMRREEAGQIQAASCDGTRGGQGVHSEMGSEGLASNLRAVGKGESQANRSATRALIRARSLTAKETCGACSDTWCVRTARRDRDASGEISLRSRGRCSCRRWGRRIGGEDRAVRRC
jgi:hypothetical protein